MESEPLVHLLQDKNSNASLEFCRLVNTATYEDWNTRGFKDEIWLVTKILIHPILLVYHLHLMPIVIYRKMLNLYCPAKVTYLKCFGKVFDLLGFKAHLKAFLSPLIIFIFVFLHVLPVLHAIQYRRTQSSRDSWITTSVVAIAAQNVAWATAAVSLLVPSVHRPLFCTNLRPPALNWTSSSMKRIKKNASKTSYFAVF